MEIVNQGSEIVREIDARRAVSRSLDFVTASFWTAKLVPTVERRI